MDDPNPDPEMPQVVLAALRERVLILEEVVADYAIRYGLTDKAREAMIGILDRRPPPGRVQ